jgi:hydrogenase-1 operon protein HyaF
VSDVDDDFSASYARALLHEIHQLLENFLRKKQGGAIDLLALPLAPADLAMLKNLLGRGEVSVVLRSYGTSQIYETAYAGVWWVEHRDETGRMVGRLIEIAGIPEIIAADRDEMEASHVRLERILRGAAA